MLPYVLLLLVPTFIAVIWPQNRSRMLLLLVAALYFIFIGFRFDVGMDWNNYAIIHRGVVNIAWRTLILHPEPGSYLLFKASEEWFNGLATTNVLAALVFTAGIFRLASRSAEPWTAIAVATPYLVYAIGMSAVRQSIAIGILFLLIASWDELKNGTKMFSVVLASVFHTSAILFLLVPIRDLEIRPFIKIPTIVGILLLAYYGLRESPFYAGSIDAYASAYLISNVESPGAYAHVALVLIPALIHLFDRYFVVREWGRSSLVEVGSFAALLLVPLLLLQTTIASRVSLYLWYLPILLYPHFLAHRVSANIRGVLRIVLLLLNFLYMYIWFSYANNSFAWLPYRTSIQY